MKHSAYFPKVLERLKSEPVEDARFDRLDRLIVELRPSIVANAIIPYGINEYATLCGQQFKRRPNVVWPKSIKGSKEHSDAALLEDSTIVEKHSLDSYLASAKRPKPDMSPKIIKDEPNKEQSKHNDEHKDPHKNEHKPTTDNPITTNDNPANNPKPLAIPKNGIQDIESPETFDFETFGRKVKHKGSKENPSVIGFYFCFSAICYISRLAQIDSRYGHNSDAKSATKQRNEMDKFYLSMMPLIEDAKRYLSRSSGKKGDPMRALLSFCLTQSAIIALSHYKKIKILEKSIEKETNAKERAEMQGEIDSARKLLQEAATNSDPAEYARLNEVYVQTIKKICPTFVQMFSEFLGQDSILTFEGCLARSAKRARVVFLAYLKSIDLPINFETI